jgi:hypothetical protein
MCTGCGPFTRAWRCPTAKGYAGKDFEQAARERFGATVLRPRRKDEPGRGPQLAPIRQCIESIFWTLKDRLRARTPPRPQPARPPRPHRRQTAGPGRRRLAQPLPRPTHTSLRRPRHLTNARGINHLAPISRAHQSCLRLIRRGNEFPLDLVDELVMEVEEAAQEPDDDQQVLLAVRELVGGLLGIGEPLSDVGEVVA